MEQDESYVDLERIEATDRESAEQMIRTLPRKPFLIKEEMVARDENGEQYTEEFPVRIFARHELQKLYEEGEIVILDNGILKDIEFDDMWRLIRIKRHYLIRNKHIWKTEAEAVKQIVDKEAMYFSGLKAKDTLVYMKFYRAIMGGTDCSKQIDRNRTLNQADKKTLISLIEVD